MKKTILSTFSAMTVLAALMLSCGGIPTLKTPLKNSADSLSYAYGVNMVGQGLLQYLEQTGMLQATSHIKSDYQTRMASVDSILRVALLKEMNAKIDSVNKINAPQLNEFIKGLKQSINFEEKSPYALGVNIGNQFSQQMLPQLNSMLFGTDSTQKVNNGQVLDGLISALKNESLVISAKDADILLQKRMDKVQEDERVRQEAELRLQYADSIASGDAFLLEIEQREGVVTLPSGLKYEILREGNGAIPTETDRVKVHYHGTLINGTVFDSSVERGDPATFGVTQVIAGWTEALKQMPVGSKWKLYIPYQLAYGSQDRGTIKPFSNLIFELELLEIVK